MQKTLLFFDVIFRKNSQLNLFVKSTATLKEKVEQLAKDATPDNLLYTNDSVIIQIESLDDRHIFGSYGKAENLSKKQLTRGRTKEDYKVTSLETLKELIESYTYFYLDLNSNECVILNNPSCRGFKTEFSKFLLHHFRVSSIYGSIEITNKLSNKFNESLGKANHFASISYSYTSEKLPENEFANFKEISGLNKNQIRKANVKLYLEPNFDYSKNAAKLSNTDKYINGFNSFKIDTDQESIDVVEKILSKKVSISIDENDVGNLAKIKKILLDSLINC